MGGFSLCTSLASVTFSSTYLDLNISEIRIIFAWTCVGSLRSPDSFADQFYRHCHFFCTQKMHWNTLYSASNTKRAAEHYMSILILKMQSSVSLKHKDISAVLDCLHATHEGLMLLLSKQIHSSKRLWAIIKSSKIQNKIKGKIQTKKHFQHIYTSEWCVDMV